MGLVSRIKNIFLIGALGATLAACAGGMGGGFDPVGYQNAVQLKYETMSLLDNTSAPYRAHQAAANSLLAKYATAAEGRGSSDAIAQQWAAIRDPRGPSTAGTIEQWKKAPLRPGQRAEKKRLIAAHFDHLICLEKARGGGAAECAEAGVSADATPAPAPTAAAAPAGRPPARGRAAPKPPAGDEPEMEAEPQKE